MSNYLIAGAGNGLGFDLVKHLVSNPEHTLYLMTRQGDMLQQSLEKLDSQVKAKYYILDMDLGEPHKIASCLKQYNCAEIDFFVYSVSLVLNKNFAEIDWELNQIIMNVNYVSFVETVRCLIEHKVKERPLKILVLSILDDSEAVKSSPIFAASKAAVNTYVRNAARELKEYAISINAIAPLFFSAQLPNSKLLKPFCEDVLHMQVLGMSAPQEWIATVDFILRGDNYNGEILPIHAGLTSL